VAQYSGLVVASVLISPHLLTYDLTVLLLPAVLLGLELGAQGAMRGPAWGRTVAAVIVLLLVCNVSTPLARACAIQLSVPAMFALLAGLAAWRAPDAHELRVSAGRATPE
jgi:hypothetical protein